MLDAHTLAKLLEYGKISATDTFSQIGALLGLEFYYEQENDLYTLSNEVFVLDISKGECTLLFVDESLNARMEHIRQYLLNFTPKQHVFFHLLRYLTSCTSGAVPTAHVAGSLERHKCICSCIFTGEYCQTFDLSVIPENFNIFTHRQIDLPVEYYFYTPGRSLPKIRLDEFGGNIAQYIAPENFDKRCFGIFHGGTDLSYEEGDVKVVGKSVYVKGRRLPIASLAFIRGNTLKDSLQFEQILDKPVDVS